MKANIVLVLENYFEPTAGGVQQSTVKLAKLFRSEGHKVSIISVFGKHRKTETWQDFTIEYIGSSRDQWNEMRELLKEISSNFIINQSGFSIPLNLLLYNVKPKDSKLISTHRFNPMAFVNNFEITVKNHLMSKGIGFLNNKLLSRLILFYHFYTQNRDYNKILNTVDAFVILSESYRKEIASLCRAAYKFDNKIYSIPNLFPLTDYKYELDLKKNVILSVGRINIPEKRVDILMSIWQKLQQELMTWEFWIVGSGPEEENMKSFCKKNGLSRIRFWGRDIPDTYYYQAKILHFTSASEGFPNVLVEAQRYGCVPILFNSYSAAKDIIIDGENGFLIPPFNEALFIERTLILTNSSKKLETMALKCIESTERYSFKNIYGMWNNLFNEI